MKKCEVAIIGGGISGLTAAVYLAKEGVSTVLIEKAKEVGGRAQTVKKNGAYLNLGAHALYRGGSAESVLNELGITVSGGIPGTKGSAIWNESLFNLPGSLSSLLTTKLLSVPGKIELANLMKKLNKLKTENLGAMSLREWAEAEMMDPMVRNTFYALCRTATYCIEPEHLNAHAVIEQVQNGLKGVLYLDGGWQTMVEDLKTMAIAAGAKIIHESVVSIKKEAEFVLSLKNGESMEVPFVLSTASPEQTFGLMERAEETSLKDWKNSVKPIYAACLDVSLQNLPRPDHLFALGIDQHILYTVQSRAAKLSEDGSSVISVLKYLGTETDIHPPLEKKEMEHIMDLMQPGWRDELIAYQFLPHMAVVQGSCAMQDYLAFGPSVPDIPGFYIAGDGAGHSEMLVDAAFASAKRAASAIIEKCIHSEILKEA